MYNNFIKAFDEHMNLLMSDVEETTNNSIKKNFGLIFIRGDLVVLIIPLSK